MQNNIKKPEFVSVQELADILGISRVAVFQKIKRGQIVAEKVGRSYVIQLSNLPEEMQKVKVDNLEDDQKKEIDRAVKKAVNEYGETLRLLGKE